MRTLSRVAVSSAVLGLVLMGGQGVASAQVIPSLDVAIRLEPGAPSTGELISGIRQIDGVAEAIEGVRRVDLYVLPAGFTRSLESAVPVDSMTSDVPLSRASFDLEWNSATTSPRIVDIVVVARSATRTGRLEIPGVRVARQAASSAPTGTGAGAAKSGPSATASSGGTAATAPAPAKPARAASAASASAARSVASVAGVRHAALAAPVVEPGAAQATSFYKVYGQLPYAEEAGRPLVIQQTAEATRGPLPYVAAGLVFVVTAGHVQRAVRVPLGRRY